MKNKDDVLDNLAAYITLMEPYLPPSDVQYADEEHRHLYSVIQGALRYVKKVYNKAYMPPVMHDRPKCKGTNCGVEPCLEEGHSPECQAEMNNLYSGDFLKKPNEDPADLQRAFDKTVSACNEKWGTALGLKEKLPEPPEKKYDGGKADIARFKRQFPKAIAAAAFSGMYGAVKYEDDDGTSFKDVSNARHRYNSAGSRHDLAYAAGEMYAEDSHVHHLSAKAWNAMAELEMAICDGEAVIDPAWELDYMADWERQRDELNGVERVSESVEDVAQEPLDRYGIVMTQDQWDELRAPFLHVDPDEQV
jgi:hypothetical protein